MWTTSTLSGSACCEQNFASLLPAFPNDGIFVQPSPWQHRPGPLCLVVALVDCRNVRSKVRSSRNHRRVLHRCCSQQASRVCQRATPKAFSTPDNTMNAPTILPLLKLGSLHAALSPGVEMSLRYHVQCVLFVTSRSLLSKLTGDSLILKKTVSSHGRSPPKHTLSRHKMLAFGFRQNMLDTRSSLAIMVGDSASIIQLSKHTLFPFAPPATTLSQIEMN